MDWSILVLPSLVTIHLLITYIHEGYRNMPACITCSLDQLCITLYSYRCTHAASRYPAFVHGKTMRLLLGRIITRQPLRCFDRTLERTMTLSTIDLPNNYLLKDSYVRLTCMRPAVVPLTGASSSGD